MTLDLFLGQLWMVQLGAQNSNESVNMGHVVGTSVRVKVDVDQVIVNGKVVFICILCTWRSTERRKVQSVYFRMSKKQPKI